MTKKVLSKPAHTWATRWLDTVASGASTMSQRKVTSIEARGGSLQFVARLAKRRGVDMVLSIDDHGIELVVASKKPFKVIC